MNQLTIPNKIGKVAVLLLLLVLAALVLVLAMGWWAGNKQAARLDTEMRERLLHQTVAIANTINPDLVRKLNFTAEDKGTPAYEILRARMISYGKFFPNRGIYSMSLRKGKIFFGPENYAESDPMASPSGTEYKQASPEVFKVFKDKRSVTVGPETDEYGTFVSALTPVLDPHTDEVLMIVGVDVLAGDWQSEVNTGRIMPLLVTLSLILLFAGGAIAIRRRNRSEKGPDTMRLKSWIIVPTALVMLGGLFIYGMLEYFELDEESRQNMLLSTEQTQATYNQIIAANVTLMSAQMDFLAGDPALLKAWQQRDLAALTALAQPFYEKLKLKYGITHYYMINPDRTCFLRAYQPDRRGDIIDRSTLLVAEKTGEDAWGVELGTLGSFTLRYVRPLKQAGAVIGYLELGIEIDNILNPLARDMNLEVLTVIRKEYTTRENFESGQKVFGFRGQWDTYPDFVVAHQTIPALPAEVAHWLEHRQTAGTDMLNASMGGKRFTCYMIPLFDVAGRNVSELILMRDVTGESNMAENFLLFFLGLEIVLFGGILILLWSVTGAAERRLSASVRDLREKEESYRRQFSENSNVMLLIDPADGRIIDANAAALRFYGRAREQLLSMSITEINILPVAETLRCMASVTPEHGKQFEFDHRLTDGSVRNVTVSASLIQIGSSRILHTIIQDITERKRIEKALQASEQEFRSLAEAMPQVVWITRPDGWNIYFNKQWVDYTGLTLEESYGHGWNTPFHPDDRKRAWDAWENATQHNGIYSIESRLRRADGVYHWWLVRGLPIRDANGKILKWFGTCTDIEDIKRAEEALRESERFAQATVDALVAHIAVLDDTGTIIAVNRAWRVFAEANGPLLSNVNEGANCLSVFDDASGPDSKEAAPVAAGIRAVISGEKSTFEIEYPCHSPDTKRWFVCRVSRFPRPDTTHIVIAHENITARKLLEEEKAEIEEQNRQLQKSESLGRMAGAIAHHFNNQLSVVLGYLEMAISDLPLNDSRAVKLTKAMQAAREASEVSGLLLAYLGQIHGKLEFLDLAELCRMSLPVIQAGKPENVVLETDLPSPGPYINADAKHIQQILTNLIINAWEAIGEGTGLIHLSVKTVSPTEIPASHRFPIEWGSKEQSYACLEVMDSGCGIREEDIDKLFDPFFSTKFTGRGLGLPVVLGIVKAHDSVITVENRINGGSIFKVFFPLSTKG